jgi:hypothetical protein
MTYVLLTTDSIISFLFTADAVQKIKVENTVDQHVLKVEMKTEVEEDRDQFGNQVSVSSLSFVIFFYQK